MSHQILFFTCAVLGMALAFPSDTRAQSKGKGQSATQQGSGTGKGCSAGGSASASVSTQGQVRATQLTQASAQSQQALAAMQQQQYVSVLRTMASQAPAVGLVRATSNANAVVRMVANQELSRRAAAKSTSVAASQ